MNPTLKIISGVTTIDEDRSSKPGEATPNDPNVKNAARSLAEEKISGMKRKKKKETKREKKTPAKHRPGSRNKEPRLRHCRAALKNLTSLTQKEKSSALRVPQVRGPSTSGRKVYFVTSPPFASRDLLRVPREEREKPRSKGG